MNWSVFLWIFIICPSAKLQTDGNVDDSGPNFEMENSTVTNLTVYSGTDFLLLNCSVSLEQLVKNSVSWIKVDEKKNLKLLTVDHLVYSPDYMYNLIFLKPNNFQLRLNKLVPSTSGEYQCQISTHPPKLLRYYVNVVAPTIEIVDDGDKPLKDKIFKMDSTLELRCKIFLCCFQNQAQYKPDSQQQQHVNWYHEKRLLNNDTFRGGISVKSELRRNDYAVSKLYVANVNKNDAGYYRCSMPRFGEATVLVSVLHGETPQAMQVGRAFPLYPIPASISTLLGLIFLFV